MVYFFIYLAPFVRLVEVCYVRITVTRLERNINSPYAYFLNLRKYENQHNDRFAI